MIHNDAEIHQSHLGPDLISLKKSKAGPQNMHSLPSFALALLIGGPVKVLISEDGRNPDIIVSALTVLYGYEIWRHNRHTRADKSSTC